MEQKNIDVYKFTTESGNTYLFDNASGMVFPCDEAEYYTIQNVLKMNEKNLIRKLEESYGKSHIQANMLYQKIKKMMLQGYFVKNEEDSNYTEISEHDELDGCSISRLYFVPKTIIHSLERQAVKGGN
jgi:hypothetical protein